MDKKAGLAAVYNFLELTDQGPEDMRHSRYQATREAILRLGGKLIEGTEHWVPVDQLDELGRYRRVATGWGELD
jgi:hypothetical protein